MTFIRKYTGMLITVFLLGLSGCKENEIYPETPSLKFKDSYTIVDRFGNDSLVVVIISYKDGDGDIGLLSSDTLPPFDTNKNGPNGSNTNRYSNNIWIDYYEKFNGEFYQPTKPFTNDTIFKDTRVGVLTPEGKHKAIRGDIEIKLLPEITGDTIKFKIRLLDRALHISNPVESPEIYLHQ